MIRPDEIEQFARLGAVTIDTPFTPDEIAAAAAAMDRLLPLPPDAGDNFREHRIQGTNDILDSSLVNLIQHPFLEDTARRVLLAAAVDFYACAIVKTYPIPGDEFRFWEHVDIKYSTADLDAAPRRMICSCLIWLTDVTRESAPLMFRPGSHRLVAAEVDRTSEYIDNPQDFSALPDLSFAESQPALAKAGQMTVATTAMVHGASNNVGDRDRKVMFVTFVPMG